MITLTHGQVIRVKGFYRSTSRIRVRTSAGMAAEHGDKPLEGAIPWTLKDSAILDGRDKSAHFQQIDAAPEIEHGQQVIIEGCTYRVKVNGQGFFDPVAFIPIKTPDWAVLGPKLEQTLLGAQKALRRALPHCPADGEHNGDSVFVGEWLDEVNEALALLPAA